MTLIRSAEEDILELRRVLKDTRVGMAKLILANEALMKRMDAMERRASDTTRVMKGLKAVDPCANLLYKNGCIQERK